MTPIYRIAAAARLAGVSDDTVRRWIAAEGLPSTTDEDGRQVVAGTDLAEAIHRHAARAADLAGHPTSARNRLPGIVTDVRRDAVMAQVEIQAGPHRIVSLISADSVDVLGLEPGVAVTASVKATNVVVERGQ
jgi:molybdopterin-binding protein